MLALVLTIAGLQAIVLTGQSLSVGCNSASTLTSVQVGSNLMWSGLSRAACIDSSTASAFPATALVESGGLESPMSAMGNYYRTATGSDVLMIRNGKTATAYSGLALGTTQWNVGAVQIEAFGSRYVGESVIASVTIHGESDRLSATYEDDLVTWQSDIETKAILSTETVGVVPMYVSQMSSCTYYSQTSLDTCVAPIEQYLAAKNNPGVIILAGPRYHIAHSVDGVHMASAGYRQMGAEIGKAIAVGVSWEPTWPTLVERSGAVIDVTFHVPVPPLVLDTTNVSDPGNYGFTYTDDSSPPAISTVALLDSDTVRITLASTPTGANKKIRYAYTGTSGNAAGPTTGMRGNLRDSDTATWNGVNLYNWAVHFTEDVP